MTPRIISVMNLKGGVGKTTTVVSLGHALSLAGHRVALLDMDPQSQVAVSLGLDEETPGMDQVLSGQISLTEALIPARERLHFVSAGPQLIEFEYASSGGVSRAHRLQQACKDSDLSGFDYILIDCPPSAGLLGINALFFSSETLVPVSTDYLSIQGLSRMVQVMRRTEQLVGKKARLWLACTRMQMRRKLSWEVHGRLVKFFPSHVLQTSIRESVALAACVSRGQTVFDYQPRSAGAVDYLSLAEDLQHKRVIYGK